MNLNTTVLACLCAQGNLLRFVQMTNVYLHFPSTFRNEYSFPEGCVYTGMYVLQSQMWLSVPSVWL